MKNNDLYLFNFLNKYGYEKRIKKDNGCWENAKYRELKVKWSIRILISVDKSIKTKANNNIK